MEIWINLLCILFYNWDLILYKVNVLFIRDFCLVLVKN